MSTGTSQRQYAHHMLREIHEQPTSLTTALDHYVRGGALDEASFTPSINGFATTTRSSFRPPDPAGTHRWLAKS